MRLPHQNDQLLSEHSNDGLEVYTTCARVYPMETEKTHGVGALRGGRARTRVCLSVTPPCPWWMAKEVANKAPRSCHTSLPGWNEPDPELNHSILVWEPGFGGGFFQLAEAAEFMQERRVVSGRNLCGNCLG